MKTLLMFLCLAPLVFAAIVFPYKKREENENLFLNINILVEKLPDCALKRNLRAVSVAEYHDESEALEAVIQRFHADQLKDTNE